MSILNETIATYLDAHKQVIDVFVQDVVARLPGHIADDLLTSMDRDEAAGVDPDQPTHPIVRKIRSDGRFMRVALTDLARTQTPEDVAEAWADIAAKSAQTAWEMASNVVALPTAKMED